MASDSTQTQRDGEFGIVDALFAVHYEDLSSVDIDIDDLERRIEALPEPHNQAMHAALYALAADCTLDVVLAVVLRIIHNGDA